MVKMYLLAMLLCKRLHSKKAFGSLDGKMTIHLGPYIKKFTWEIRPYQRVIWSRTQEK